jgi:hypothetical protein
VDGLVPGRRSWAPSASRVATGAPAFTTAPISHATRELQAFAKKACTETVIAAITGTGVGGRKL